MSQLTAKMITLPTSRGLAVNQRARLGSLSFYDLETLGLFCGGFLITEFRGLTATICATQINHNTQCLTDTFKKIHFVVDINNIEFHNDVSIVKVSSSTQHSCHSVKGFPIGT